MSITQRLVRLRRIGPRLNIKYGFNWASKKTIYGWTIVRFAPHATARYDRAGKVRLKYISLKIYLISMNCRIFVVLKSKTHVWKIRSKQSVTNNSADIQYRQGAI